MTAFLRIAAVCLAGLICLPLSAAERVALVIGINDYPSDSNFPDLKNCILDAELIKDTLGSVDFEVIFVKDPTRSEMEAALLQFEGKIEKGGTAVVYYAGHGIELDGQNYLMASNAKFKARSMLSEEAFKAETVGSAMVLAGAKSSFLLLDCCREIPADAEWAARGSKRYGLAEITIPGDIMIGLAAAPGKPALEPRQAGENGPYAQALAKWIPTGLDHLYLFQKVRQEVNEITGGAQRTWEKGSFLAPFYFAEGAQVPGLPGSGSDTNAALLAEMKAKLEEVQRRNQELEKAMANRNTSETEIERLKKELETANREAEDTMKKTGPEKMLPEPTGGPFSGTRRIVPGQPFTSSVGTKFVWVEPGTFTMGSSEQERRAVSVPESGRDFESLENEKAHRVHISKGYWVGEHEVTIEDYLRFLNQSGQWDDNWVDLDDKEKSPIEKSAYEFRMRSGKGMVWGNEKLPMTMVSWEGAIAYCDWLNGQEAERLPDGFRISLPTEAEWEKAARAGSKEMTYEGNLTFITKYNSPELGEIAWYFGNSGLDHENGYDSSKIEGKQFDHKTAGAHPVGLKRPNSIGAFDMIGNVKEWCLDWWAEDYYQDDQMDPMGPASNDGFRVNRGGGWVTTAFECRAAFRRFGDRPHASNYFLGFRVCVSSLQAR